MVASLIGGRLSDRSGRRTVFVCGAAVVFGAAMFVLAVATGSDIAGALPHSLAPAMAPAILTIGGYTAPTPSPDPGPWAEPSRSVLEACAVTDPPAGRLWPVRTPVAGLRSVGLNDPTPGGTAVRQMVRVQNFTVSSDGFGAGEGQSLERPFGHADPGTMFSWAGATASWPNRTDPGGSRGLDDYLVRDFHRNIGAEIMGRNKFSPFRGPWADHDWQGWWDEEPPFHTPVFVMTHYERPSLILSDTTFHFVDGEPKAVLEQARGAADGRDVRLGGGADTIRQFLDADLVDTLHVVVCPVTLGRGSRLWGSPEELFDRFHCDVVPSPSGVVHHLLWRR